MKIPLSPPEGGEILKKTMESRKNALDVILSCGATDAKGRYLHWDQMRYRKSPKNLTPEEWWLSTKIARRKLYKNISLKDKDQKPLVFAMPDFILKELHWLDQNTAGNLSADRPIIDPHLKNTYLIRSLVEEANKI